MSDDDYYGDGGSPDNYDDDRYDDDDDRYEDDDDDYAHYDRNEEDYDNSSDYDQEDYAGYDDYDPEYEDNEYEDDPEDNLGASAVSRPKSKYEPEISPKEIKDIIKAAMAAEDVKEGEIPVEGPFISPEDASDSRRYLEARGFAWFSCSKKHNRWPSAQSWCFIDLKAQSICYRDKQGCKKCDSSAMPEFQKDSIQKMAKHVVRMFLRRMGRSPIGGFAHGNTSVDYQGGPHDEDRCGKCKRLGHSCWKT